MGRSSRRGFARAGLSQPAARITFRASMRPEGVATPVTRLPRRSIPSAGSRRTPPPPPLAPSPPTAFRRWGGPGGGGNAGPAAPPPLDSKRGLEAHPRALVLGPLRQELGETI